MRELNFVHQKVNRWHGIRVNFEPEVGTQTTNGFLRTKNFTFTLPRVLSGARTESACIRGWGNQLARLISYSTCLSFRIVSDEDYSTNTLGLLKT